MLFKIGFLLSSLMFYILSSNTCFGTEIIFNNDVILSQQAKTDILESEKARLLKLDNVFNARDLGGIKISDKSFTRYKVCIRSDSTDELSDSDIIYLKNYGLKTVIDLRSKSEVENFPDKLANVTGVSWYNIDIKSNYLEHNNEHNVLIGDDYVKFIKYTGDGNFQKQVLDLIANSQDGTILFHCTGGKDRTGIIAMFLLELAGVNDEDVINNYVVSFDLIKEKPSFRKIIKNSIEKHGKEIVAKIHYSSREKIESSIKFIRENYGSFEKYFLKCGVNEETINKIKNKLVCSLSDTIILQNKEKVHE